MIITSPYVPDPEGYPGGRSFGLTIRGRRMGAGLTLRRCAEDMGISMTELSNIERGLVAMTTEQRERFEGALRAVKGGSWHDQCHIVRDRVQMVADPSVDEAGESVWFAVHSPDHRHYLDENDGKWKPGPQAMAGWFMSESSARAALLRAPCPPGVEPTEHDWKMAGVVDDRPMLGDTEPRRLTDDELGGRAALEAAGLEPVDGWDDERGKK
jgi:transcriptional regulator with XRE-family HTH domain